MSKYIGIDEARKSLGALVDEAHAGGRIVLTRHGRAVARIVPVDQSPTPTMSERISTLRAFATPPGNVGSLGLEERNPAGWALSLAEVGFEAEPFGALIADIDAFFGDELDSALTGPEAADAEAEVCRIIAEHLTLAATRLSVNAAEAPTTNWATMSVQTLQQVAGLALRRAADLRFVEIVSRVTPTSEHRRSEG